jgi:hypothetical protein
MGMTIDEARIALGKERKYALHENKQAFDIAIDTMRKYQKIEEAYKKYQNNMVTNIYADGKFIKALKEVLEDGSENNHHASNS